MSEQENETTVLYQQFLLRLKGDEIRITFSDNYDLIIIDKHKNKHYFVKHPKIEGHWIYDGFYNDQLIKDVVDNEGFKDDFNKAIREVVTDLFKLNNKDEPV